MVQPPHNLSGKKEICTLKGDESSDTIAGMTFEGKIIRGTAGRKNFAGKSFIGSIFENFDAHGAIFESCNFSNAVFNNVNFYGAKFNNVTNFNTIVFTGKQLFDDNTEINGVDITGLASNYPLIANKLRQHRYLGKFKVNRPKTYFFWQLTCKCGRSWGRLSTITAGVVVLFSIFYFVGTALDGYTILPCLEFDSVQDIGVLSFFQFSALAFVSFNMPDVTWTDKWTGIWVAIEAWLGLAFIGILVTVIATNISRNE